MNYFEFYDLPESFDVDKQLLKARFDDIKQQCEALPADEKHQLSVTNEKAYQILSDVHKRLGHLLWLHELLDEGAEPQLPGDFVDAVTAIEQRLMQADDADQIANITSEVLAIEADLLNKLHTVTVDYPQLNDTAKEDRLNRVLEFYYQQKYLLRIRETLNTFAARF